MKLLIIGHSVLDHIKEPSGFRFQPGGIFYTARTLSLLKQADDILDLCTLIEEEHYHLFGEAFSACNREFSAVTERIPRVHLTIFDKKERCERFENLNNPVQLPDTNLSDYDGILINMISGFELQQADLARLRADYHGPIYFDVHSLSRGVGNAFVRDFRKIPHFSQWAKHLTFIQANENELFTLSEQYDSESAIAEELIQLGVQVLLVTKGEKGVTLYMKNNNGTGCMDFPALKTKVVNKVGCGDVFGAYFFYHYINNKDVIEATRQAVLASGCITTYRSFSEYSNLLIDVAKYNH